MADAREDQRARLWLLLIGLPLLGGGLAAAVLLVWPDVRLWLRAREFVAVPATLLHVELETHSSRRGTTDRVHARYGYTFGEQRHESTRVAISESADNIGGYQRELYTRLRRAQDSGAEIDVWVDPTSPTDALLDRDMRWGMLAFKLIFASAFALVGGLFTLAATGSAAKSRAQVAARSRAPITASARRQALGYGLIAIAVGGYFAHARGIPDVPLWLGLLLGLAWLASAFRALVKTLQWRRFGVLELQLDESPARLGGVLSGALELPERFDASDEFWWRLACVRNERTPSSGRSRVATAIWQEEALAKVEPCARGVRLRFRFDLPRDLPPSPPQDADPHAWTLHLSADLAGADLDHSFEVPVASAPGTGRRA